MSSANKGSRPSRNNGDTKLRGFVLEDKNPRRGMGPRSVNPIPNFSMNGSDEHIYIRHEDDGGTTSYDTDLESGRATHGRGGVIVKQTSVEVIETRHSGDPAGERDVGDYYLVKQSQREAERLARKTSVGGKRRRSSATFGVGRSV
jgi:hypothetical protein